MVSSNSTTTATSGPTTLHSPEPTIRGSIKAVDDTNRDNEKSTATKSPPHHTAPPPPPPPPYPYPAAAFRASPPGTTLESRNSSTAISPGPFPSPPPPPNTNTVLFPPRGPPPPRYYYPPQGPPPPPHHHHLPHSSPYRHPAPPQHPQPHPSGGMTVGTPSHYPSSQQPHFSHHSHALPHHQHHQPSPPSATTYRFEMPAYVYGMSSSNHPTQLSAAAGCTCKKSRCLKLYCQCFASSATCGYKCKCGDCSNTPAHKEAIDEARQTILLRNPSAFEKGFFRQNFHHYQRHPVGNAPSPYTMLPPPPPQPHVSGNGTWGNTVQIRKDEYDSESPHRSQPMSYANTARTTSPSSMKQQQQPSQESGKQKPDNHPSGTSSSPTSTTTTSGPRVLIAPPPPPMLSSSSSHLPLSIRFATGCKCRRSMCLKKYCECYQNGIHCNASICQCTSCQNVKPTTASPTKNDGPITTSISYSSSKSSEGETNRGETRPLVSQQQVVHPMVSRTESESSNSSSYWQSRHRQHSMEDDYYRSSTGQSIPNMRQPPEQQFSLRRDRTTYQMRPGLPADQRVQSGNGLSTAATVHPRESAAVPRRISLSPPSSKPLVSTSNNMDTGKMEIMAAVAMTELLRGFGSTADRSCVQTVTDIMKSVGASATLENDGSDMPSNNKTTVSKGDGHGQPVQQSSNDTPSIMALNETKPILLPERPAKKMRLSETATPQTVLEDDDEVVRHVVSSSTSFVSVESRNASPTVASTTTTRHAQQQQECPPQRMEHSSNNITTSSSPPPQQGCYEPPRKTSEYRTTTTTLDSGYNNCYSMKTNAASPHKPKFRSSAPNFRTLPTRHALSSSIPSNTVTPSPQQATCKANNGQNPESHPPSTAKPRSSYDEVLRTCGLPKSLSFRKICSRCGKTRGEHGEMGYGNKCIYTDCGKCGAGIHWHEQAGQSMGILCQLTVEEGAIPGAAAAYERKIKDLAARAHLQRVLEHRKAVAAAAAGEQQLMMTPSSPLGIRTTTEYPHIRSN